MRHAFNEKLICSAFLSEFNNDEWHFIYFNPNSIIYAEEENGKQISIAEKITATNI